MRFELIPSAWKAENLPLIYIRVKTISEPEGLEPPIIRIKNECLTIWPWFSSEPCRIWTYSSTVMSGMFYQIELKALLLLFYHYFKTGRFVPYLDLLVFLLGTPLNSNLPRIHLYFTPGKSCTLPPRINTDEKVLKLWPSPGI